MGVRDSSEGTGPSVVGTDPRLGGWSMGTGPSAMGGSVGTDPSLGTGHSGMGIGSSLGTGPKSAGSEGTDPSSVGTDPCVIVCEDEESADSGDSSSIISKYIGMGTDPSVTAGCWEEIHATVVITVA